MQTTAERRRGTNVAQSGDIDENGDVVDRAGSRLAELALQNIGAPIKHYSERPGLDERLEAAGGDPAAIRRMLGVAR